MRCSRPSPGNRLASIPEACAARALWLRALLTWLAPPAVVAIIGAAVIGVAAAPERAFTQQPSPKRPTAGAPRFIGFDKNDYPGDRLLPALRRSFSFTGYWLNNPPGAAQDSWTGKRSLLVQEGFGFLLLWNGRLDAELKQAEQGGEAAEVLGRSDGAAAIAAAQREGFPPGAILFLDQEEGGRLLPEQLAYLTAWTDAVGGSDFRAGIYCSGIQAPDGEGTISTAEFLRGRLRPRPGAPSPDDPASPSVSLWIVNDQCPPSPGCQADPPNRAALQIPLRGATVWQYARSPRAVVAQACRQGYAADDGCYAPGTPRGLGSFVDLDLATSADPSAGR